jgi:glycosyltransferase involved in cell wall biosynthesis
MRIVLVINRLIHGGAETQVIALGRELAARGHAVIVHTLSPENPRADELTGSGVQLVAGAKRGRFDLALVLQMRRTIREFDADIVHGFLLEGNLYARLATANTDIPVLNSERGDNYRIPMRHQLALMLTRHMAAGLVANSHSGARFGQRLLGLPADRVDVVWNGIDVNAMRRETRGANQNPLDEFFPPAPGRKVACLIGMLRPEKDHGLALRVARALREVDAQWRVLFVGDALPHTREYKDRVVGMCRELGLDEVVVFAGLRRDTLAIARAANVLFSTSLHEGFPNVVIEAMSVGTPVVSTEYSDIRLILPNPWQVVAGRDPVKLAGAIVRADLERAHVSTQQSDWLRANATLASQVDQLEAVYRKYTRTAA